MNDVSDCSARARAFRAAADELHDRTILVTGAGAGLGRTAARSFAAHGATVILLGRTRERLESVHDEIVAAGGPNPAIAVLDLASAQASDYYALADKVNAAWGRLDGLLHNAGVLGHRSPIEHYDVGTWHQVMHLNLNAPFIMTQVLLPVLRASPDASIVFTSSSVGRRGRAYWGAYAVSKFGIEGLAQVLADETANQPGLRVNCLNPGRARTAMRRAAYPGEDPASVPDPDSLMAPYLYLMSRASRGISGQSLDCQM